LCSTSQITHKNISLVQNDVQNHCTINQFCIFYKLTKLNSDNFDKNNSIQYLVWYNLKIIFFFINKIRNLAPPFNKFLFNILRGFFQDGVITSGGTFYYQNNRKNLSISRRRILAYFSLCVYSIIWVECLICLTV